MAASAVAVAADLEASAIAPGAALTPSTVAVAACLLASAILAGAAFAASLTLPVNCLVCTAVRIASDLIALPADTAEALTADGRSLSLAATAARAVAAAISAGTSRASGVQWARQRCHR